MGGLLDFRVDLVGLGHGQLWLGSILSARLSASLSSVLVVGRESGHDPVPRLSSRLEFRL